MNEHILFEIASRVGVERSYRNAHGEHTDSPPQAVAAVLQALGYDVSSDAARERTLAALQTAAKRPLPAASVVAPEAPEPIEIGADGDIDWRLVLEDGSVREGVSHADDRRRDQGLKLEPLPAGYHRLTLGGSPPQEGWVLAAPPQAFLPDAIRAGGRGFGVTAQVYGLRSPSNFGIGDLSDVGDLAEGAGRFGAAFLGLSPLHALFPTDRAKISPYSPSSRLFIDPIYIDPTVLPDFPSSTAARFMNAPECAAELDRLRATNLVEHAASWEAKRDILARYWPRFGNAADPDFLAYRAELGEPLELHATFEALSEQFAAEGKHWVGDWPAPFRDAQGEAVFAVANDAIDAAVLGAIGQAPPASLFVASSGAAALAERGADEHPYGLAKLRQEARFLAWSAATGVPVRMRAAWGAMTARSRSAEAER